MKNLFNKSTKILLGLSVWLVLSSVGMIAFADDIIVDQGSKIACYCTYYELYDLDVCAACSDDCHLDNNVCKPDWLSCKVEFWNPTNNKPAGPIKYNNIHNDMYKYNSESKFFKYSTTSTDYCTYQCDAGYHHEPTWCVKNKCKWNVPTHGVDNNPNLLPNNHDTTPWTHADKQTDPASQNACTYSCDEWSEWDWTKCELKTPSQQTFEYFFYKYKVNNLEKNILIQNVWDSIMDKLDDLLKDIDNLFKKVDNQATIPAWAIMAFDATKTNWKCPSGWSLFSEADGRFLMWASSDFLDLGWWGNVDWEINKIRLAADNIPPHKHYMFSTKTDGENMGNNSNVYDGYVTYYSSHNKDEEYQMRGMWSNTILPMKGLTSYQKDYKSTPDTFDITNAYVKVLYCVKYD